MKKFCVIAVDREGYVPRDGSINIQNGLMSLENQTFKDFNVVICHDGPKTISYEEEGVLPPDTKIDFTFLNTPEPMSSFGNYSRDLALRYAYDNNLGEYYIHHNIDNEFFPDAFQNISDAIDNNEEDIFIFPIHHWKMLGGGILTGVPPVVFSIDNMQLVAHRDIWKEVGFWYNKHRHSDGYIFEDMCRRYPWKHIPKCIGHNY